MPFSDEKKLKIFLGRGLAPGPPPLVGQHENCHTPTTAPLQPKFLLRPCLKTHYFGLNSAYRSRYHHVIETAMLLHLGREIR